MTLYMLKWKHVPISAALRLANSCSVGKYFLPWRLAEKASNVQLLTIVLQVYQFFCFPNKKVRIDLTENV